MDEQLMEELAELPGWDSLVDAGAVGAVDQRVLERVQTDVRLAAEREHLKARARHRRRWGLSAAALVTAAAVAGVLVLTDRSPHEAPAAAPATPTVPAASCVEAYSLTNLAHRSLAFDGTVDRTVVVDGTAGAKSGRVKVMFLVNHWFRGGTGKRVTVITSGTSSWPADQPQFQAGTRLLVSGETQPAAAPMAWNGCGFTRPYDKATAMEWESVLKR